ncbi:MAG: serine/threonine protein kinase, partial [Planctomycetes bacterium]|nr:serine/threonine protein kinase [Planctomycetota bacterium]
MSKLSAEARQSIYPDATDTVIESSPFARPAERSPPKAPTVADVGRQDEPPRIRGGRPTERVSVNCGALSSSPDSRPQFCGGHQFGRYLILRELGQGAMGAVYLARDSKLDRDVALKIPKLSAFDEVEAIERFRREARAAATLRHPHICPVYDVGEIDGVHYLSMAYIDGCPLSQYDHAALGQQRVAEIIYQLALALEEAHRHGVLHRDLKPENVMVDGRGEPIIMDFGLARRSDPEGAERITHTGVLVGTPAYMSPEQVDEELGGIDAQSDVYSLGVV